MDFKERIPRKKQPQKQQPKKSRGGHTIIKVPSDVTYNTDNIAISNDHNYDDYHGTNKHIRDINNPGDGSDSSNFSSGDPTKRRQQQSDSKERKIRQKRQQVKDELKASQQNWDNKRKIQAFSMDDAYEHTSKPSCFDGVRIDAPINKNAEKLIDDAERLVNNDDHHSRHTKKKSSRGKSHNTSSIANLEGSGRKRGRMQKQQPYSPCFAGSNIGNDDPLDVAAYQQGTNRKLSRGSRNDFTKKMGQNMDVITQQTKFGNASMTTARRKKKSKARDEEVIDVDSDERNEGSGKKRKTSPHFAKPNDPFDSPNASSVNQGDDGFRVEGDWDSQGSGGRNDDVMAALDGANQYANFGSLKLQRDPKKKTYASKRRSYNKPATKTPTPQFNDEIDEIEEYSDNESSAGNFGESKRSNNNSNNWLTSNRGRGRTQEPKSNANGKRKQSNKTKKKLAKSGMLEDTDEEWINAEKRSLLGSTNTKRLTRSRSRSRKAKKKDEVIEILDSSSEEESSEDEAISIDEQERNRSVVVQPKRKPPSIGDLVTIDAARIAVGKKVVKSKCELSFQFGTKKPYMQFSWNNKNGKKKEHKVSLKQDSELVGLNYYVPEENYNSESNLTDGVDDSMTVIAFKIKPTDANQFTIYTKSYDADSYVTVEVRDTDQFVAMLKQMKNNPTLEPFLRCDPIEFYHLKEYTAALIEDTEKENINRRRSTRLSRANAKKKSNTSDKPILVFPFKAGDDEFFTAASTLKELNLARGQTIVESERPSIQPQDSDLNEAQAENENERVKGSARTHYITIREDDMERLEPGEFLNDSLVDFWMKWISGAPNNPNSDVHIFTSHFMSTLASDGPKAVSSWTAKKKIDIFEKKLIFVPVNSDLHWSLCVVVNPGFIANNYGDEMGISRTEEGSFLLFLDSLKMHQKNRIAKNIHGWLNFEWRRLKKGGGRGLPKLPFDKQSMPVFTPTIPYQDNGCDCGVFVCRYAYNLFQMRNNCFSQFDMADDCRDLFQDRGLFKFGMKDIARIRGEMVTLIRNLAKVYQRMKKLEKAKKKSKSTSNEADGNSSSDAAAAEETTDGGNKSEGLYESFDSNEDNLATVKREDESRETSGDESPLVPKEKENVENSSDTSRKDDEIKNSEEGDGNSSSDNEKSQDLLEDDESSVAC